jgi:hypothetical protein
VLISTSFLQWARTRPGSVEPLAAVPDLAGPHLDQVFRKAKPVTGTKIKLARSLPGRRGGAGTVFELVVSVFDLVVSSFDLAVRSFDLAVSSFDLVVSSFDLAV